MPRVNYRTIGIALLVIVAVALAAATFNSTVQTGGGGIGTGIPNLGPNEQNNQSPGFKQPQTGTGQRGAMATGGWCFSTLLEPPVQIGLLVSFLVLAAVVIYRYNRWTAMSIVGVVFIQGLVFYSILIGFCGRSLTEEAGMRNRSRNMTNISELPSFPQQGQGTQVVTENPLIFAILVIFGIFIVGALAYVHFSSQSETQVVDPTTSQEESFEEEQSMVALDAVGEAAGEAADRIEEAGNVDNEVYRAWKEMTSLLDIEDPETSTPGEFAIAAINAGMDRDHVETLTSLFEDVRYGGVDPTESDEQRAIEALREIEESYSDETS